MRLISSIAEMQSFARQMRAAGKALALVPTMGALHAGHLSLVRAARRHCDVVVVSIFVNPTQFGHGEDFNRYPRDLERDLQHLEPYSVDAVFAPGAPEMYPEGYGTFVEPGALAAPLEGAARPGHFRGVATVVLKLLNVVQPDVAFFGQKDFQQALVVRSLIENWHLGVRLVICPTVREPDGLAMSSRNAYLSLEERAAALVLYRSLRLAEELVHTGETETRKLLEEMWKVFAVERQAKLDYVAIVDARTFQPVERVSAGQVALVAARIGTTRLIDNLIFGPVGVSPETLLQLALTAGPAADTLARVPGAEAEALRLRIENCRACAAISAIGLPPRQFLTMYLKRDYPDLSVVRVAVTGRDAPNRPENFLYANPEGTNRFVAGLYELVGVKDFTEFRERFILTDAIRCHALGMHVPERALANCARHLTEELKLFPNLEKLVVLGEDAYLQFQQFLLERNPADIKPFSERLSPAGWGREEVRIAALGERLLRVFYCYHPTYGYDRSPSIATMLG